MGAFPRGRENAKIVGKLEKLVEDRGEFRGTGNSCRGLYS